MIIVMELCPFGSLQRQMYLSNSHDCAPFTDMWVWHKFLAVAEALDHMHRIRNTAHNDIKDENILIDKNGVPKASDFGISQ